jgi:hypothetical protein
MGRCLRCRQRSYTTGCQIGIEGRSRLRPANHPRQVSSTSPAYGSITTSTPAGDNAKNAILRYYVVGTGSGGAQTAVSLGQIDPNFGGTAANSPAQPFVAFQAIGGSLLSAPVLVIPGGPAGSTVPNLTTLQLLSVPALARGSDLPSTSVNLSGLVNNPGVYTPSSLQSNPSTIQPTVETTVYTSIPLHTFLNPGNPNNAQIVVGQAPTVMRWFTHWMNSPTQLIFWRSHRQVQIFLQLASPVSIWAMMVPCFAGVGLMVYRRKSKPASMAA